jgi:hypothetical protein
LISIHDLLCTYIFQPKITIYGFYYNADSNFPGRILVAMNDMASLLRLTIYTAYRAQILLR